MNQETQANQSPKISTPRKAIDAIKNSKSYADIQHFYKTKLQYASQSDREQEHSYVLGYN